MREILFRGKQIDTGAWVEGAFCMKDCDDPFGELVDRPSIIKYEEPHSGYWFRVDPETVGQFTGLTDKNGKKIFEGDIISYIMPDGGNAKGIIECGIYGTGGSHHVGFGVNWYNRHDTGWLRNDLVFWVKFREIEVIGNIHDNPELLRVENG